MYLLALLHMVFISCSLQIKEAKSSRAKVRQIYQEYPNEFLATPAGVLQCNLCNVLGKCKKKVFYEKPSKK